jgi:hypothetical protein
MSKPRSNRGAKRHLEAREREVKALELRKAGLSYPQIGKALGVSQVAAYKIVMRVLQRYEANIQEETEDLREIELQRLDRMLNAIEPKIRRGDLKAIAVAVRISERRSRLLGLDLPQKMEHTSTPDAPVDLRLLSDAELEQRIDQLLSACPTSPDAGDGSRTISSLRSGAEAQLPV